MNNAYSVIVDKTLTFEQKVIGLARVAENELQVLKIDPKVQKLRDQGIICDLFEGSAPYRPRYIVPDYEKFMKVGSEFLSLKPPTDIWEACNNLLILYRHVPSITTFPVYIGNIDYLLEPFIKDEKEALNAIKLFLTNIDRTITDSFCHANIGPIYTKAGKLILAAERELQNAIPNITLKCSEETSEEFMLDAIDTALITAKPSFANHKIFSSELGENYGIASCYNGLHIGGGSHTLVRLNLAKLAKTCNDENVFINEIIPQTVDLMAGYMDERIKFLMEESTFFESSFLVRENLISKDRFTSMFGMFGLAECVNHFIDSKDKNDTFGKGEYANELGLKIIEKLHNEVNNHDNKYCKVSNNKFLLHAQVGIETDEGISPGCRIPIGDEPEVYQHLIQSAKFHKYFPSGIGDIFNFDSTCKNNPRYVLDIIRGAFKENMRYISVYSTDCDVIRITGYLVKRSEMEKLARGEQVLQDTVVLGLGSVNNNNILKRKIRENE